MEFSKNYTSLIIHKLHFFFNFAIFSSLVPFHLFLKNLTWMGPSVLATRNTIWLKLQPTQPTTNLKIYFFTSWKSGAKNIQDEQLGISRVQQHGPYNRKRDVNNGILVNSLSSSEWITGFKMLEVAVRKRYRGHKGGAHPIWGRTFVKGPKGQLARKRICHDLPLCSCCLHVFCCCQLVCR